jgi:DNA-binding transcriptional LysR family regulator
LKSNLQVTVMRQRDVLEGVSVFVSVAEAGSFSEAARRLGVSPSAVSQAIRGLEERLGAALFRRSTRSVALTDVGEDYLRIVSPALSQLRHAAEEVSGRAQRPAGPLKLTMARTAFDMVVAPVLVAFQERYPEIRLEVAVEARMVDIVQEGFDAGFRTGNRIDKDMVAVPVASRFEAILVAAPGYLDPRSAPTVPSDLLEHRALMCRSQATGVILPWTLRSRSETVQISPPQATIIHDIPSQIELATRGLGIVSLPLTMIADLIERGSLQRVLPAWASPIEPLYLYFPSRRHQSAALRAFIAFLTTRVEAEVSQTREPLPPAVPSILDD